MKATINHLALLFHGLWLATLMLSPSVSRATDLTLELAKAGAEKGDAEAEFVLGKAYYTGAGVPLDYAKAFDLYQKAATQGYAKAQNNLATMYRNGQGGQKDSATAVDWFQKAAGQGATLAE